MSENIYNVIKREYEKKQLAAMDSLQKRKAEIYASIPQLEEVESRIYTLGIKYSKNILLGIDSSEKVLPELEASMNELKQERKSLLSSHGICEAYLEAIHECPICKDTGVLTTDSGTERCSCYKQMLIKQLYNQSNLNLTKRENFGSFDEGIFNSSADESRYGIKISPHDNILRIKDRCMKFIDSFDSKEEKNLFFSGPAGVGKTFMCSCIANELISRRKTVLYQTAPLLFSVINEFKTRSFRDEDFQDSSYRNIFEVELLIIDDLGTEPLSASRYAELLTILNTRQANNLAKPCKTIISTNFGPKQLYEYYTERVGSRIVGDFEMLRFAGDDIRLTNSK